MPRQPPLIIPATEVDQESLARFLAGTWHVETVVGGGRAWRPADHPGVVAVDGDVIRGHASWDIHDGRCYLVAIAADPPRRGTGGLLLEAFVAAARAAGCSVAWLITTNDNLDALRFYQRRGFRITEVRHGAVDEARREMKPSIPIVGSYGIGMHDELILERML